jgi:membrane protein YqaA with SNARE-associated domain
VAVPPISPKPAEPILPKQPVWLLPGAMCLLSAAALAAMVLDPVRQWLWGFIPYTFLGNSLAPLPYDGYVIALGKSYPIWLIVAVGVAGTMLIEQWNMELLARILAREGTRGFRAHPVTRWAVRLYERAPFWSLVGTCVLPIVPHYPMRVLATLARYPMWKYQLTVLLGRGGRYAWLAALGFALHIPEKWIVLGSLVLLLFAYRGARKMNRYEEDPEPAVGAPAAPAAPTPASAGRVSPPVAEPT